MAVLVLIISLLSIALLAFPLIPTSFLTFSEEPIIQVNRSVSYETSSTIEFSTTIISNSIRGKFEQVQAVSSTETTTSYATQSSTTTLSSTVTLTTSSSSSEVLSAYQLSDVFFGLLLSFVTLLGGSVWLLLANVSTVGKGRASVSTFQKDKRKRAVDYETDEDRRTRLEEEWREQYMKREQGRQKQRNGYDKCPHGYTIEQYCRKCDTN
jgi:hypothetical protein